MNINHGGCDPPFPWIGGKAKSVPIIRKCLPNDIKKFVEVFGGGGALTFSGRIAPSEIYNDFNGHLANLMWHIQNEPEYMENLIMQAYDNNGRMNRIKQYCRKLFCNSRDNFAVQSTLYFYGRDDEMLFDRLLKLMQKARNRQEKRRTISLIKRILKQYSKQQNNHDLWDAVMFYELLKCSFSATTTQWGCKAVNCDNMTRLINNACQRLQTVAVENKDFVELIKLYDKPDTLFYCDPPYVSTEDMYNDIGEFSKAQHIALCDLALNIQGKMIVSYNDCDLVRELYSDPKFTIIEIERFHSMSHESGNVYREVLIGNYDIWKEYLEKSVQLSLFEDENVKVRCIKV